VKKLLYFRMWILWRNSAKGSC